MAESILRYEVVAREVEIPDGFEVCTVCEGRGMVSKYDLGWRSVVHSEELATRRRCVGCQGRGYREKEVAG